MCIVFFGLEVMLCLINFLMVLWLEMVMFLKFYWLCRMFFSSQELEVVGVLFSEFRVIIIVLLLVLSLVLYGGIQLLNRCCGFMLIVLYFFLFFIVLQVVKCLMLVIIEQWFVGFLFCIDFIIVWFIIVVRQVFFLNFLEVCFQCGLWEMLIIGVQVMFKLLLVVL